MGRGRRGRLHIARTSASSGSTDSVRCISFIAETTVDQRVVHLAVHGEPAVVQPLHHVQLPQRAVPIEQAGVQPGGQLEQLADPSRRRQRRAPNVVVDVDVGVVVVGPRQGAIPPMIVAGCLRNVGWNSSLATMASVNSRTNSGPAPSGGSNNDRPPTCMGCSRDSASRNTESVGAMSSMRPLDRERCATQGL